MVIVEGNGIFDPTQDQDDAVGVLFSTKGMNPSVILSVIGK